MRAASRCGCTGHRPAWLLTLLSVFEGGFTLEAAEAVIDLSALEDPPWTLDVLQAAGTKWNFLPFRPGLVGGH